MKNPNHAMIVQGALLLLFCIGLSCAGAQQVGLNDSDDSGETRILIATRESDFKAEIVNRLVADHRDRSLVKVVELSTLDDVRTADYDALVVMGARMGWLMFSARERRFLRRLEHPEKLVMVMTAAHRGWEWERDDVDVITCASTEANVEPTYREVSQRLETILEGRTADR